MTRLPHESRDVRGYDPGDNFTPQILEEVCSHPHCDVRGRENLELHELWPRSFLRGQPIEFVQLWDGTILGNQVYLCNSFHGGHHQAITENKALIEYHLGNFYWFDNEDADGEILFPQPVYPGEHDAEKPQEGKHPPNEEIPRAGSPAGLDVLTRTYGHALYGSKDSDGSINIATERPVKYPCRFPTDDGRRCLECDTCQPDPVESVCPKCRGTGKAPEKPKKKEPARNRVSKSIRVPKDEQENGVEVLEDAIEQVEEILRPGEKPRSPYYTVTDALLLVIVNKDVIL
jgi:hypothetical protein